MTRRIWIVAGLALLPCAAAARQAPRPPAPPALPAPAAPAPPPPAPAAPPPAAPLSPEPPPPPAAPRLMLGDELARLGQRLGDQRSPRQIDERMDRMAEEQIERVHERVWQFDSETARDLERQARHMAEMIRAQSGDIVTVVGEQARLIADAARQAAEAALADADRLQAPRRVAPGPPPPGPVVLSRVEMRAIENEADASAVYNTGLALVQRRQYDRAIEQFDRLVAQKGLRTDGALYWKAFSETRLARVDAALATLAALRRGYPQSRYLTDAKVLEADLRKMSGQPIDPEAMDANDEIKLLAINGIANTDPDRAIPLLEGVLNATNTLGNKKRALYVLALNDDARAHQVLLRYAKGGGTPELQLEAVRYLALRHDAPAQNAELRAIYEATQDTAVRRAIIEAFRATGDKGFLVAVIKDRTAPVDIKRSAINSLGTVAPPAELWAIYQQEPDADLRGQIVSVFASLAASEQLLAIIRGEKDAQVRLRAVRSLGQLGANKTGAALIDLYGGEPDPDVRRAVISALAQQNNAEALVAIARKETSLDLKRDLVRRLSELAPRSKVAADYLMDVIR